MYQVKEQDNTPEKQPNEVGIGNLPEKEFRIMTVKMIQDLRKRIEAKIKKMQEMFNKDLGAGPSRESQWQLQRPWGRNPLGMCLQWSEGGR